VSWSQILNVHTWDDVADYSQYDYEDNRVDKRQKRLPHRTGNDKSGEEEET